MMTFNNFFLMNPNSQSFEHIILLHDYVMLFLISVMVMVLFIMKNFSFKLMNFDLSFIEHHQLEYIWTLIPFLVLFMIIFPSIKSLYFLDSCSLCGLNVSIMGHQWYWSYEYSDLKNIFFDSYMLNLNKGIRLIDVDNSLILPVNTPIHLMVSSSDVIHSWSVPSLGLKMDAVPGRLNQFCCLIKYAGLFIGQCSEICGVNHSFMPILVESY